MIKSVAAAFFLAAWLATTDADAQMFGRRAVATYANARYAPAAQPYPYSYYAAYPNPARGYVGYGASDAFPFYGQPYGHAYDKWTWAYLPGGGYQASLARYYDPPVK
jgi:hypothetical protein